MRSKVTPASIAIELSPLVSDADDDGLRLAVVVVL